MKTVDEEVIIKDKRDWISEESHRLFKQKSLARNANDPIRIKQYKRLLQKSLRNDRLQRVNDVAKAAQTCLKNGNVREAYENIHYWYKEISDRTTNSTVEDISKISDEYEQLYQKQNIQQPEIPTYVNFEINDNIPDDKEIVNALRKLKNRKAPGASGITVEDLKQWQKKATNKDKVDEVARKIWSNVVSIIKTAFEEGNVPKAFTHGTLVLIPKAGTDKFRGIALLETIYKLISMIVHRRFIKSIGFHDAIHGFRVGRGTSTAIINIKLLMQLARRKKEPLYLIFLDVKKAYDSLDRERTLGLLKKYGVGSNIFRLLKNLWRDDTIITKQKQFYGRAFKAERGVRQGDIVSPTIFNIVIDAVIRNTYHKLKEIGEEDIMIQFYADDGIISGKDYDKVQRVMDMITSDLISFGLVMNSEKTEAMAMQVKKRRQNMSQIAYNRKVNKVGLTYKERQQQQEQCKWCDKYVQHKSLARHYLSQQCKKQRNNTNRNNIEINNENEDVDNDMFCRLVNDNNNNNDIDNRDNNDNNDDNMIFRQGDYKDNDNDDDDFNNNNCNDDDDGSNNSNDNGDNHYNNEIDDNNSNNYYYDNNNNNMVHNDNNNENENEYCIDMPQKIMRKCPVPACPFHTNNGTSLRKHFRVMHPDDIIIILQEGLLPRCHECGLYQANVNTARHLNSEDCKKYANIRNNRRFDICQQGAKNVQFQVNGEKINMVQQFNYLGRVLANNDNDFKAVESQLVKARRVWGRIGKVIKKKSFSNPKIMSIFYKVIVQTVLLYGSESWVLGTQVKNKLNSFHNRCSRFITGKHINYDKEADVWIYPSRKSTLLEADLLGIEEYIEKRKNTIWGYVEEREILEVCKFWEGITRSDNTLMWWK